MELEEMTAIKPSSTQAKRRPSTAKKKAGRPKTKVVIPKQASTLPAGSKQIMTSTEAALAARIASQDSTWQTVTEADVEDFSLMNDPMPFPKPAVKLEQEKRFKFRWIARTPNRIDEMTRGQRVPLRWWIVNSTNPLGVFAPLVDPTTGGIHSLDQILVFKPWWMHEVERAVRNESQQTKDDSGNINKRHGISTIDGTTFLAGSAYKISGKDEVQFDEGASETEQLMEG